MNLLARAAHYATMLRLDVLNLKIPGNPAGHEGTWVLRLPGI